MGRYLRIDCGEPVVEGAGGEAAQGQVGGQAGGAGKEGVGNGPGPGEVGHPPLNNTRQSSFNQATYLQDVTNIVITVYWVAQQGWYRAAPLKA